MKPSGTHSREEDATASEGFVTHVEQIRETVCRMDAEEVSRQLPNLVETVASASTDEAGTKHFLIGISFTTNDSLLDYRLDRYVVPEGSTQPRYETLKSAVSREHVYLTFPYPPDPNFTAEALRGALLAEIERQTAPGRRRGGTGNHSSGRSRRSGFKFRHFLEKVNLF